MQKIAIENEHTFKECLKSGVNVFLGAGFSVLAENEGGESLPTGEELRKQLIRDFELGVAEKLDLGRVSTILERTQGHEFRQYLKRKFTVSKFDDLYLNLLNVSIKGYFTVNIDNLLEEIYSQSAEKYLSDLDVRGPADSTAEAVDKVSLHGSVLNDETPLTFSGRDIATAFSADPDRWHFLTHRLQQHPTLFWGTSANDADILESLHPQTVRGREHKPKWIVLNEATPGDHQYFSALGFQVIQADTRSLLSYLSQLPVVQRADELRWTRIPTRNLFPDEKIPARQNVPLRPIADFYRGLPPTWSDIYSGVLHRTKHFASVVDQIHAGKHVVVLGTPASGKSTLLMQIASDIEFRGHKIMCTAPSPEKSKLIINRLQGDRALIFVDNFGDSIQGYELLTRNRNVQVVAADRSYNYEIVSHRVDKSLSELLDVTDLEDSDIQSILARIPRDIKLRSPRAMGLSRGASPSLYEIVESNLAFPALKERYKTVIQDLQSKSELLVEFLIVVSYVAKCRTETSMEMMLAYFREDLPSYKELYNLRDELSRLVTDYSDYLGDEEQDYFAPRSSHIAEAVMDIAPQKILKRVMQKFHERISKLRIHRFDIFRKKAFDKEIMLRAFPDWSEGKAFYQAVYLRDHSPYLLQQGALYLAANRQFSEAFHWIDDAVLQTESRIPSIRNSHAIILFMANVHQDPGNPTVRKSLQQSMTILSECYSSDRRKLYHAIRFAEQALEYFRIYGDSGAIAYLETADSWIKKELDEASWNRDLKRLSKAIDSILIRR